MHGMYERTERTRVRARSRRIEARRGGESFEVANRVRGTVRGYIAMLGAGTRPDDGWRHGGAAVMFLVPARHPPDRAAPPAARYSVTEMGVCMLPVRPAWVRLSLASGVLSSPSARGFTRPPIGSVRRGKVRQQQQVENAEQLRLRVDRMELWFARNRWKQTLFCYFLVPPVALDRPRRGGERELERGQTLTLSKPRPRYRLHP